MTFTPADIRLFRATLLRWFARHRRPLPWRDTGDPYRVWISEIMLQQTRVGAVLDHYARFLRRFPDLRALAAAKPQDVLAAWSGLGYYRRARALHQAARIIVREHGGELPATFEALLSLPGIGRYTAAAIASIAFQQPRAVVDGNVERVLRRLLGGHRQPPSRVWDAAQQLLSPRAPGNFNQAMMELGAVVCLPQRPRCDACPVRRFCATASLPLPHPCLVRVLPGKMGIAPRQCRITAETTCALAVRDSRVYLVRRGQSESLMPGMWELPLLPNAKNCGGTEHSGANGAPHLPGVGQSSESPAPDFTLRHSITVTDHTVHVRRVPVAGLRGGRWIPLRAADAFPLTGLARRILRHAGLI